MSSDFESHKEASKQRRANNRAQSAKLLTGHGLQFESKNLGSHLIVTHKDRIVDFWPGTGKFVFRGKTKHHRGVFKLLNMLGVNSRSNPVTIEHKNN